VFRVKNLEEHMNIVTDRLIIRLMNINDVDDSFEHRSDIEVSRYAAPPLNKVQTQEKIQQQLTEPWSGREHQKLMLAIELKTEQKLIGEFMFKYTDLVNAVGEVGYRFNRSYQGKGYAYEAVSAMIGYLIHEFKVQKINAVCATKNQASWKLMEKLGMQKEGLLRSHFILGEQREDAYTYGILASDLSITSPLINKA